jgi:hypothetical protein
VITSWREDCAEIWQVVAKQRADADDFPGMSRALVNREILAAAQNLAEHRPGANW